MFNKLGQGEKWYLSNGKYVDDKLFMFGLQRQPDHPSRSLSIDHYDENYTTYNVSTQQGLQKIITYNPDSTAKLRTALRDNHTFQPDYNKEESFDKDWINLVIFSLV
ncbi:hypothetical protein BCV72DRAFT_318787 [Rhizopus microsporus var. microsporus]|uniref:Uncharacterized protein n=1 Tax=Rhizopus microsporus var. microsporus TaxID=86635 RepID=A0A1X0QR93_RHIZD|nr:hypothetical protein BCV72DRAFT_318787 [Rhizopus microsporus var. microsporus]